jgi:hypothetical protein
LQGIEHWNKWRRQQLDADLSNARQVGDGPIYGRIFGDGIFSSDLGRSGLIEGADLSNANLSRANLREANLRGDNLGGADLSDAHLRGADLSDANLRGANLSGANLRGADLSRTDLCNADLSRAKLNNAKLSNANLEGADLSRAKTDETIFASLDLRTVKGLVEIQHIGPSRIELYSVQFPQDGSALHFLRGVGVPDEWIDFWRATMMHPIQYHSLFISYSSQDDILAHRLNADLQARGVRCWFAPHDMRPGTIIRKEIDKAIHLQDKLLLLLSKDAVTSGWVYYEVEVALAREREQLREILFPVRLDETVLQSTDGWAATLRRTRHIGDFTKWTDPQAYQIAFERLLQDLKKANHKEQSLP